MNRIQSLPITTKHAPIVAAMFAFVLLFAGFANADPMSPVHARKAKKGHLTITAPTEVGGALLQPGEYEVKEAKSSSGHAIEFVHQYRVNEYLGPEFAYTQEDVVARVQFTELALSSPPKKTHLILTSNAADAAGLQIRGNDVTYEFAPSQAAKADGTAVSTYAGQQY